MNMQHLEQILTCYGPSGREGRVADVLKAIVAPYVDTVETDAMGNLIAVKKGDGTGNRIMVSAHMDHIGLIVIDADEQGFLRVGAVGGVHAAQMVSGHVVFEDGVCGVVGADEKAKLPLKVSDLYVDIGAQNREEALNMVGIGAMCVMKPRVTKLGAHRLASPAMDDRIACHVLAEAMTLLPSTMKNDVVAVFSVQEEVGLRGAKTAAYACEPNLGIAVDVTPAGDVPELEIPLPVRLNGGAAIKIMDRSMISTPSVAKMMEEEATNKNITVQREVLPYGGTDAGSIQMSRGGVASGVISIPCRYVHSEAETVDLRDVQACVDLLVACVTFEK